MSEQEREPWRERVAMLGTEAAVGWLPGSLGWRDEDEGES